jgi:mono/diheme cytochrome c family protein
MFRAVIFLVLAFWLIVGLGVFVIALSGGPSGLRKRMHGEGGLATFVRRLVIGVVFAGTIAVSIVVSIDNARHKPKEGPAGITLTSAEAQGRGLFAKSCSTCHTLAAVKAVGRIGPDLDVLRPPTSLVLNAIQLGRARGAGQMPADIYTGQDAKDVAQFVSAVAGQ